CSPRTSLADIQPNPHTSTPRCVPPMVGSRARPTPWRSAAILTPEDVRMAFHDATVGLPEVLTAEDVRARLDPLAAWQSVVLPSEDVRPRLAGARGCLR